MAKKSMDDAINYFRMGKSLRECEKLTGIPFNSVKNESVKRGVKKGDLVQLTSSIANNKAELCTLSEKTVQHVLSEAEQMTKHILFFNQASLKNCSMMMKKVSEDMDIVEHKMVQETLSKARETVVGKMPDTAVQINNTQQAAITSNGITPEGIAQIHEALGIVG